MLLLVATTAAVIKWRKEYPYLVTGWFWYLGMLVPVLGLVQVGLQAHADRYTYLPQIGVYLSLTWAVARFDPAVAGATARFSAPLPGCSFWLR